jgi:hypothetical protein
MLGTPDADKEQAGSPTIWAAAILPAAATAVADVYVDGPPYPPDPVVGALVVGAGSAVTLGVGLGDGVAGLVAGADVLEGFEDVGVGFADVFEGFAEGFAG